MKAKNHMIILTDAETLTKIPISIHDKSSHHSEHIGNIPKHTIKAAYDKPIVNIFNKKSWKSFL